MAKNTVSVVTVVSDLSGVAGAETIKVRGRSLDLTPAEVTELKTLLAPYNVEVLTGEEMAAGGTTAGSQGEANAVRTWATGLGIKVADRGRIAANVTAAYNLTDEDAQNDAVDAIIKAQG